MTDTQPRTEECLDSQPQETVSTGAASLVAGILDDAQKLVRQQVEMLKAELHDDFQRSKRAAEFGGLGVVLLTVGLLGLLMAVAYFLHERFQFAMWISWSITSAIFFVLGIVLATISYILLERVHPLPHKTLHALRENLTWKIK
jgi:uncharacterized membrane protein YqjE